MIPYIVSHTRTGTHYLAFLLFRNFELDVADYEDLHYSHSRTCPNPYIHLWRPVFPVMLSIWRNREHLGIASIVSFSDMLRTPWEEMPKAETCQAVFNGKRLDRVCPPQRIEGTLLTRWLKNTQRFADSATLNVRYSDAVERPYWVLGRVTNVFSLKRKSFVPVLDRVGWWPAEEEVPSVSDADMALMEEFQRCLLLH